LSPFSFRGSEGVLHKCRNGRLLHFQEQPLFNGYAKGYDGVVGLLFQYQEVN